MNTRNPVNGANYLALGILSLVVCPFFGPIAWTMSNNALSLLDQYEPETGDLSQRGLVVAGRICGIIGSAFCLLAICLVLMRSCALSGSRSSSFSQPASTITVDGHPVSPEEQRAIEEQIKASDSQPTKK